MTHPVKYFPCRQLNIDVKISSTFMELTNSSEVVTFVRGWETWGVEYGSQQEVDTR